MNKWSENELMFALALYCQIPFGKMHSRNPEIIKLAEKIGRTPSAVAMKLVNFASLDPEITKSGRRGLGNASELDKKIWSRFNNDWEKELYKASKSLQTILVEAEDIEEFIPCDQITTRVAQVEIRTKQALFRKIVLSSYSSKCCISGLSEPRLLVASHIIPWNTNSENRLNPKNGLCLSTIHDKAFDRGLMTILPSYKIVISSEIKRLKNDSFAISTLLAHDGNKITLPEKFIPSQAFLEWHNNNIFLP